MLFICEKILLLYCLWKIYALQVKIKMAINPIDTLLNFK